RRLCCSRLHIHVHVMYYSFFFSSKRRHTRSKRDWSSDVCSSHLEASIPFFIARAIISGICFGAVCNASIRRLYPDLRLSTVSEIPLIRLFLELNSEKSIGRKVA